MNTQGKRHLMKESEVDDEVDLLIHQSWREYPELISELDQSKNIGRNGLLNPF